MMPVTETVIITRVTMPNSAPLRRDCGTCPVAALSMLSPFLGSVRAGEPTINFDYQPEENPLRGFRGIIQPVTDPCLSGAGIAVGDTLLISTRYEDVARDDLYSGRLVLAIDPEGTTYVGCYDDGKLCDDRGVIAPETVEVVGVVCHVLRGV